MERDFLSYLDDLKCEETMKDPDAYYKNVQIINFDMTHHQSRGDPLTIPLRYYQTVTRKDVNPFEEKQKKSLFLQQLETKEKQNNHFFLKKDVVTEHFKQATPVV